MNPASDEARREVVEVCRALDAAGLMPNKSGNVSCRTAAGFLITPSGVPYAEVTPARLVTGLITERGVCEASAAGLRSLFPEAPGAAT